MPKWLEAVPKELQENDEHHSVCEGETQWQAHWERRANKECDANRSFWLKILIFLGWTCLKETCVCKAGKQWKPWVGASPVPLFFISWSMETIQSRAPGLKVIETTAGLRQSLKLGSWNDQGDSPERLWLQSHIPLPGALYKNCGKRTESPQHLL